MKTTSKKDHIYLGKRAGEEIIRQIKSAKKSVKIVSPYLSPIYIQELIALHKGGRAITLITTDNLTDGNRKYSNFKTSDLIKTEKIFDEKLKRKRKKGISFALIVAFASIIIFSLSFSLPVLLYPSIVLFLISIILFFCFCSIQPYKINYSPLFKIKVFDSKSGDKPWSTELVHSKIFIIDESKCFLGSANFTYSGFKTHYETVIQVEDPQAIRAISEEVENLYNSDELRAKPVEEWGRIGSDLTDF